MPVAENVPVRLVDVDEFDPPSPHEIKVAPTQANKRDAIYFFISRTLKNL
jgi:hypothetical protein